MFLLQDCVPGPFGWYVVRDGDTLASVCAAQGAAYASLIAVNRLQKFPPPGSLLCLPPRERVYTGRHGGEHLRPFFRGPRRISSAERSRSVPDAACLPRRGGRRDGSRVAAGGKVLAKRWQNDRRGGGV